MRQSNSLNTKGNFIQKTYFSIFLLLTFSKSYSAVCTATSSGNWENPAVWSCGHVPTCADNIIIPSGYTITITTVLDYNTDPSPQAMSINISGVLNFNTGKKITLPSGSIIYVNAPGSIQPGGGGGTSNLITIGNTDVWKAGDGAIPGPAILTAGGLPIELVYFSGSVSENNTIKLIWQTATENNNDFFEVERSNDGITFEAINKIQSKSRNGNSGQTLNYEVFDLTPKTGINYYRLKQVDFNTTFTYSQIQSVEFNGDKEFSFTVFPNPSEGATVNIALQRSDIGKISVVVYDANGKTYYAKVLITKESDSSIYAIDPSNKLAPGIYTITASFIERIYCKRLVVN